MFDRDALWILLVVFAVAAISVRNTVVTSHTLPENQNQFLTGDEPSYLLITQSMVLDKDVNLWNDCFDRNHGVTFHNNRAGPHKATYDTENQRIYSIHNVGLSVLFAPFLWISLKTGVPVRFLCTCVMNVIALVLVATVYTFSRRVSQSTVAAFAATLFASLSLPWLVYSSQLYPELLASLLSVGGLAAFTAEGDRGRRYKWALLGGASVALLPWLNIRYGILSAGLCLALALYHWKDIRYLVAALIPSMISAPALMWRFHVWYGSVMPSAPLKAQGTEGLLAVTTVGMFKNLLGILADINLGLWTWAPVYALVPAGLCLLFLRKRRLLVAMLVVAGPYTLLLMSFKDWFGGFCPPTRYLMCVVPISVPALATLLASRPHRARWIFFLLSGMGSVLFVLRAIQPDFGTLYAKQHIMITRPLLGSDRLFSALGSDVLNGSGADLAAASGLIALILLVNYALIRRALAQAVSSGRSHNP